MEPGRRREDIIFLITGSVMIVSELWKQLTLTFVVGGGAYQWWYFPWQLCSVPMYICILIFAAGRAGGAYRGGHGKRTDGCRAADRARSAMLTFLADFTLMSGAVSFLDTSGFKYTCASLTVHSYIWHLGLIALGIYAGTRNRDTSLSGFIPAAGIYLGAAVVAEAINLGFDSFGTINMFYINPHYSMGQIVFSSMAEFIPNNLVICIYIGASVAGGFIFHIIWNKIVTVRHRAEGYPGQD